MRETAASPVKLLTRLQIGTILKGVTFMKGSWYGIVTTISRFFPVYFHCKPHASSVTNSEDA